MFKPIAIGYLGLDEKGQVQFIEDPRASLRIYEYPDKRAVIGSDVCEGLELDESASIVLGIESNNTLAAYNSNKIDPDEFAIFNKNLATYYNMAFVGIERNAVGFSVVSDMMKIYPTNKQYFNYRYDEKRKIKTKKFGWISDQRTRHLMLSYLKQEIRESSTELRDKQLIHQCMRFIIEDGKPQAAEGEKDDIIFARAIAGMMRRHRLAVPEVLQEFKPDAPKVY